MTLWRVRATVDDRPGFLAVLTASLALRSINILAVQVHTTEFGAVDDFLLDAPDSLDEAELLAAVEKGRGRDAWAARAEAYDLVDPPAQMAALSARVTADPTALPAMLSKLLGGCLIRYEAQSGTAGHGASMMRLADPGGGMIVLTRLAPGFTPAEFARAQSLVDVARAALTRTISQTGLMLVDGSEVVLRTAGAGDLGALLEMHGRCGENTLYRRYMAGTRGPTRTQLGRLVSPAHGVALLAEDGMGNVVALGNLIGEGEQAEAALLVEDGWQRKGLGTALLRRIMALAEPSGFRAVVVHTHADNEPMLRTVRRMPQEAGYQQDSSLVSVTLRVPKSVTV